MAAVAILDNFEWPYLRNGSQTFWRDTEACPAPCDDVVVVIVVYSAHRAVIFAIAQLSCKYFCNSIF